MCFDPFATARNGSEKEKGLPNRPTSPPPRGPVELDAERPSRRVASKSRAPINTGSCGASWKSSLLLLSLLLVRRGRRMVAVGVSTYRIDYRIAEPRRERSMSSHTATAHGPSRGRGSARGSRRQIHPRSNFQVPAQRTARGNRRVTANAQFAACANTNASTCRKRKLLSVYCTNLGPRIQCTGVPLVPLRRVSRPAQVDGARRSLPGVVWRSSRGALRQVATRGVASVPMSYTCHSADASIPNPGRRASGPTHARAHHENSLSEQLGK